MQTELRIATKTICDLVSRPNEEGTAARPYWWAETLFDLSVSISKDTKIGEYYRVSQVKISSCHVITSAKKFSPVQDGN